MLIQVGHDAADRGLDDAFVVDAIDVLAPNAVDDLGVMAADSIVGSVATTWTFCRVVSAVHTDVLSARPSPNTTPITRTRTPRRLGSLLLFDPRRMQITLARTPRAGICGPLCYARSLLVTQRFQLVRLGHVLAPQYLAVREDQLFPVHHVGAVARRVAYDLDPVARLDLIAFEAVAQQHGSRAPLGQPLLLLAVGARHGSACRCARAGCPGCTS